MGRAQRLALGAIAAAVAAGQVSATHVAAAVALAAASVLLVGEARGRLGVRACWPIVAGAALIVVRLTFAATPPAALSDVPIGDGPWRLGVETVGSPHDGQQTATLATLPGAGAPFRVEPPCRGSPRSYPVTGWS